ncbi:MAG: cupin domain-containing protein [Patescibacteria group bacterium]|nr:cupin domain-containing protein [Patescibacteria group bacterium]
MFKVVRKSEVTIRKIADNKIAISFITKDISKDVSLATTEATDYYEKETAYYNRIYYVLEGNLILVFNNEEVTLNVGDVCYVEKGTKYEMKGTFKAIIVNQPAFGTQ